MFAFRTAASNSSWSSTKDGFAGGTEVEDSLIGFLQAQELVAFLSESVEAAKRAVEVSLIQYREGAADYTRVLTRSSSSCRLRIAWYRAGVPFPQSH
jgi:hypothetical protein